jgi:hypothetical protein
MWTSLGFQSCNLYCRMIERYFSQAKVLIRLRSGSVGPRTLAPLLEVSHSRREELARPLVTPYRRWNANA